MPDGSIRALWDDARVSRSRRNGFVPRRASRVEATLDGPRAGFFHVDFSPLADVMGEDRFRVCLMQTFERYDEANAAEVAWLIVNYIMEGVECDQFGKTTTCCS